MDRRPNRWSRLLIAFMVALFCAGTATVVTAAEDYNDNWVYCRGASPWDPLYWYFRCYLPEDPRSGQASLRMPALWIVVGRVSLPVAA